MSSWQLAHLSAQLVASDYETTVKPVDAHWLASVIIPMEDGIIAVQKPPTDTNDSHWQCPGGKLGDHETLPRCAVREVNDAANLTICCDRLLYVRESYTELSVEFYILARLEEGAPELRNKSDDLIDMAVLSFDSLENDTSLVFYPSVLRKRLRRDLQHPPTKAIYIGQTD